MERQQVIDVRVPLGTAGSASGTLLLEERPPVVVEAAAPPLVPPRTWRLWAWRVTVALAVVLVLAGLVAFASSPPPV